MNVVNYYHYPRIFILLSCLFATTAWAQDGFQQIKLDDLSAFRSQAGNWRVVGQVSMSPTAVKDTTPPAKPGRKKSKEKDVAEPEKHAQTPVDFQEGAGILLNINDDTKKDALLTNLEHGDIELELEVMMPKGSNSGIYLMGRYELQLFDSWGIQSPSFSDMGGIYRNWENDPAKAYPGNAPLLNAAKAPGLWQTLKVSFRAPRFDANGKKISNAKFVSVELNGVKIHNNVEVFLPTGGPIENNEVAKGPIMIQGDHGAVAFRKIRYKLMRDLNAQLTQLNYKVYHGSLKHISDLNNAKPAISGVTDHLSLDILDVENEYGIVYQGMLTLPEDGRYDIMLEANGIVKLKVNGVSQSEGDRYSRDRVSLDLKAGTYPIEITNLKTDAWQAPRMALFVQTPNSHRQALQDYLSFPDDEKVSPIFVEASAEPRLHRGFVDYDGDRSKRLTHTIGVGDPSGLHYIYDLGAGNLVCVWQGKFIDATPMWHDRGDGSFRPNGSAHYLSNQAPLAVLSDASQAFPNTVSADYRSKGYKLDVKTGRPVFHYEYQGIAVEDAVYPEDDRSGMAHQLKFKSQAAVQNLYYRLAEGSKIEQVKNGYYAIDDFKYYIRVDQALQPVVREINGRKELVVPVSSSEVVYSVIW